MVMCYYPIWYVDEPGISETDKLQLSPITTETISDHITTIDQCVRHSGNHLNKMHFLYHILYVSYSKDPGNIRLVCSYQIVQSNFIEVSWSSTNSFVLNLK